MLINKRSFFTIYLIFLIAKCFTEDCTAENILRNFLENNISGYEIYLSIEEFSELKTLQETYFYLFKYISLKKSADEKFLLQINQGENRLRIIQEKIPANDILKIEKDFLKLKVRFSETNILPTHNSVLSEIDRIYNFAMIEKFQKKYVVKNNDSLVKISEQKFGTYKKWKNIYELNKNKMPHPENPDLIYPDMILVLP